MSIHLQEDRVAGRIGRLIVAQQLFSLIFWQTNVIMTKNYMEVTRYDRESK